MLFIKLFDCLKGGINNTLHYIHTLETHYRLGLEKLDPHIIVRISDNFLNTWIQHFQEALWILVSAGNISVSYIIYIYL